MKDCNRALGILAKCTVNMKGKDEAIEEKVTNSENFNL